MYSFLLSALVSIPAAFSAPAQDDCTFTAPTPTAPVCIGILDWACMSALESAFTTDWNSDVGIPKRSACLLQQTVPALEAAVATHLAAVQAAAADMARWSPLCAAGNGSACLKFDTAEAEWNAALADWATATTALNAVNQQIFLLTLQASNAEAGLLSDFFTDADSCCSGLLSAGPVPMAATTDIDIFACPPVYPGLPPAGLCEIPETYRPACLALAELNHLTAWKNYVRTFAWLRCHALDAIIALQIDVDGNQSILDQMLMEWLALTIECTDGRIAACAEADALSQQMSIVQGWINTTNAEIQVLQTSIAGYVSGMILNKAGIDTDFYNETLACCGDED